MEQLSVKQYAHLGDGVWELFVREFIILKTANLAKLHSLTTSFVNAKFQSELSFRLNEILREDEKDLVRRGRNIQVSAKRKIDHSSHNQASGFEALIGYLYLHDKDRLEELFGFCKEFLV